jgi:predicted metal-dependent enzyme (double-stranded beta helix superfamily)
LSPIDLSAYALRVSQDRAVWTPHVRFDPSRRHWARLASPPDVDLWLLTWLPSQATDLHDHGSSAAAVVVLQGQLTELAAAADGGLSTATLEAGVPHGIAVGAVHEIHNAGPDPAVSLHAYSPRLTEMTVWRTTTGGLRALRTEAVSSSLAVPA